MLSQLPILQVITPLVAAAFCVLLSNRRLVALHIPRSLALITVSVCFVFAILLLIEVFETGVISYALGGWATPWGIEYRLDKLNTFVLVFIASSALLILTFFGSLIKNQLPAEQVGLFYAAFLLNIAGLFGILITGDVFNLFVFIEIASLSSYALIALGTNRKALYGAYRYLIFGTIGATFFLIGVGFLYAVTGTLNMTDLYNQLPQLENSNTVKVALAFIVIGIALKCALFPLHGWLSDAYSYAPTVIATFFAGTSTKVFIYVLIRFIYSVFGADYVFNTIHLNNVLLPMALLAMLYGSFIAMRLDHIQAVLAYSSIAQIGYIILGISLNSLTGMTATLIHMFNHALIKTTLFTCTATMLYCLGSFSIQENTGRGKQIPWVMAAFILAGLSLIGVPGTAGFISKWYLIQAALEQQLWLVAFVVVIASLMAVGYILKIVETLCLKPAVGLISNARITPKMLLILLLLFASLNVFFGLSTNINVGFASSAANFILNIQ